MRGKNERFASDVDEKKLKVRYHGVIVAQQMGFFDISIDFIDRVYPFTVSVQEIEVACNYNLINAYQCYVDFNEQLVVL